MVSLLSYGAYIPQYRIQIADIARAWKKRVSDVTKGLGIEEKAVPARDEDAVTIAVESAKQALLSTKRDPKTIEALFIGSESHPYAVNPSSTIVGELVGVGNTYLAGDIEFACKAGTAGIQMLAGLVASGHITAGIAIGSDTAQSKPHDALEYASAAAGAAYIMGNGQGVATLLSYTSYSSDTPDFWRRDGIRYPSHAGRFSGEPAYFAHVMGAAERLFQITHTTPQDYAYCVFHMPNGKFPRHVAKRLGFTKEQLTPSLTVDLIGNPYSASTMLGGAAVFDCAKPKDRIFMVSYGSGAGSDGFVWEMTDAIVAFQKKRREQGWLVSQQIAQKTYVDYVGYLQHTHHI